MKDIETILTKSSATPKRGLPKNFTKNIVSYLDEHPRKTRFASFKEFLIMKHFTQPAIAVVAIVMLVAVSGTAYAAVGGWAGITALLGGQKKVDAARIVTVNTKNCTISNAFTVTLKNQQRDAYYYKVKDGSTLTNDQIVQMVRGYCELDRSGQASLAVAAELNKNPLNKNAVVGGYIDSKVTAISQSTISIESTMPVGQELKTFNQTFSHIDPQVIVYQGNQRLTLSDIKLGDHVSIAYRASGEALARSETINPVTIDGTKQVVVTIAKNSPDFTAAIDFQKYNGKEFEQVVPCDKEVGGYCTIEQLHS
jgi:hypothetical protein